MSTIKLKLNQSTLKRLKELSKEDKTSIEHFIELAVNEKISNLNALDYLVKRRNNALKEDFNVLLNKVPSRSPFYDEDCK